MVVCIAYSKSVDYLNPSLYNSGPHLDRVLAKDLIDWVILTFGLISRHIRLCDYRQFIRWGTTYEAIGNSPASDGLCDKSIKMI